MEKFKAFKNLLKKAGFQKTDDTPPYLEKNGLRVEMFDDGLLQVWIVRTGELLCEINIKDLKRAMFKTNI